MIVACILMSIIMKFRCVLLFLNFNTPGAPNEESQIYGFLADCFKKKQQLLGNKISRYSNLRTVDTFLKILAGVFPYRKHFRKQQVLYFPYHEGSRGHFTKENCLMAGVCRNDPLRLAPDTSRVNLKDSLHCIPESLVFRPLV